LIDKVYFYFLASTNQKTFIDGLVCLIHFVTSSKVVQVVIKSSMITMFWYGKFIFAGEKEFFRFKSLNFLEEILACGVVLCVFLQIFIKGKFKIFARFFAKISDWL